MKPHHPSPLTVSLIIMASILLSSCTHSSTINSDQQSAFFHNLTSMCGQQFEGLMTFPIEGQDSFAGKKLVAKFDSCSDTQVKVPFSVGEDHSRTWIISKLENTLELKHDHRHKDGTPDEINLYGGNTQGHGSEHSQSFFADQHTKTVIPAASTNVWTMSFNTDRTELTYHLERHQKDRFTAVLQRVK